MAANSDRLWAAPSGNCACVTMLTKCFCQKTFSDYIGLKILVPNLDFKSEFSGGFGAKHTVGAQCSSLIEGEEIPLIS